MRAIAIVVGAVLCLAAAAWGYWLVLTSEPSSANAQVGTGLVSGGLVAFVIYAGETFRDLRRDITDRRTAVIFQVATTNDLTGANLSGLNLRGLSFKGKTLKNAQLDRCDLRGVDLSYADLRGANLQGSNLTGASLDFADLRLVQARGVTLQKATLNRADARGGDFSGSDLDAAIVQDARFNRLAKTEVEQLFTDTVRPHRWHDLPKPEDVPTRLQQSDARRSDWSGTDLSSARMEDSNFAFARFDTTPVSQRRIPDRSWVVLAYLMQLDFSPVLGRDPDFKGWERKPAILTDAAMSGADLTGASLQDVALSKTQAAACFLDLATGYVVESDRPEPATDLVRRLKVSSLVRLAVAVMVAVGTSLLFAAFLGFSVGLLGWAVLAVATVIALTQQFSPLWRPKRRPLARFAALDERQQPS